MKKFSQQAAANVVPLLARILLFLAFVPAGWHHAMQMGSFSDDAAARLRELGVVSLAPTDAPTDTPLARVSLLDEPPLVETGGGMQARALHELTLTFDRLRLPRPDVWAWTVTVFELLGGAFLLLGLFSRLWAGGLALWAGALFLLWTPSIADAWVAIWSPTDPAAVLPRIQTLGQLALVVLSLGILLTGAGRFSLDGFIFRGKGDGDDGDA